MGRAGAGYGVRGAEFGGRRHGTKVMGRSRRSSGGASRARARRVMVSAAARPSRVRPDADGLRQHGRLLGWNLLLRSFSVFIPIFSKVYMICMSRAPFDGWVYIPSHPLHHAPWKTLHKNGLWVDMGRKMTVSLGIYTTVIQFKPRMAEGIQVYILNPFRQRHGMSL